MGKVAAQMTIATAVQMAHTAVHLVIKFVVWTLGCVVLTLLPSAALKHAVPMMRLAVVRTAAMTNRNAVKMIMEMRSSVAVVMVVAAVVNAVQRVHSAAVNSIQSNKKWS